MSQVEAVTVHLLQLYSHHNLEKVTLDTRSCFEEPWEPQFLIAERVFLPSVLL